MSARPGPASTKFGPSASGSVLGKAFAGKGKAFAGKAFVKGKAFAGKAFVKGKGFAGKGKAFARKQLGGKATTGGLGKGKIRAARKLAEESDPSGKKRREKPTPEAVLKEPLSRPETMRSLHMGGVLRVADLARDPVNDLTRTLFENVTFQAMVHMVHNGRFTLTPEDVRAAFREKYGIELIGHYVRPARRNGPNPTKRDANEAANPEVEEEGGAAAEEEDEEDALVDEE